MSELSPRQLIERALEDAARELGVQGELPDLELSRAGNPKHGDYASPAGLKLARQLRRPPPPIAGDWLLYPSGAAAAL